MAVDQVGGAEGFDELSPYDQPVSEPFRDSNSISTFSSSPLRECGKPSLPYPAMG